MREVINVHWICAIGFMVFCFLGLKAGLLLAQELWANNPTPKERAREENRVAREVQRILNARGDAS